MEIGIISGEMVKSRLPFPHDLEYEKNLLAIFDFNKKKDMLVINMNLILININKIVWELF